MSRWAPCKRRDFIRRLREIGFDGPFSGTRHQFTVYEEHDNLSKIVEAWHEHCG